MNPPIIQFTSVGRKDSRCNIVATEEFIVNLAPADLIAEVNATRTNFPPEVSEFDAWVVPMEMTRPHKNA